MGLDMYMYKYKGKIKELTDVMTDDELEDYYDEIYDNAIEVGYWRKANHIHAWFVRNIQNNVDECQYSEVPKEKIEELINTCEKVLKDPTKAKDLLPTQIGFFFGRYEYDEHYFDEIEDTIKILKDILVNTKFGENIYYHASW